MNKGWTGKSVSLRVVGADDISVPLKLNNKTVRVADSMVGRWQHEAKVGWVHTWRISKQIDVDDQLLDAGVIDGVTYHFLQAIGPDGSG